MESDCKYLFVYGTLLDAYNEFGAYLKSNSVYVSKGSFPGLLYNIGEYPGAIYQPGATGLVYGDIVLLNDDPTILKAIDAYEGVGEDEMQPNLYIRLLVPVTTTSGTIDCWVYLYNLPVDGFKQITPGKYR